MYSGARVRRSTVIRTYNLALIGLGNVGREFVRLLASKDAVLRSEYGIGWKLTGVASRRIGWVADANGLDPAAVLAERWPGAGGGKVKNVNAVGVEMQVAAGEEVRRLERGMSTLATIASVSPFIGLFGTVWGVMDAFSGLGTAGAASLRAVAPGIAEALITTAAGLFAAIPALIAYNHYLHAIRSIAARMDSFASEFVARIETFYSS